jgi:hypothetical protein
MTIVDHLLLDHANPRLAGGLGVSTLVALGRRHAAGTTPTLTAGLV